MWEEVFLLLFSMGQELAEMGWDGFVEQGVLGFLELGRGIRRSNVGLSQVPGRGGSER